jgi:hypothetical protein
MRKLINRMEGNPLLQVAVLGGMTLLIVALFYMRLSSGPKPGVAPADAGAVAPAASGATAGTATAPTATGPAGTSVTPVRLRPRQAPHPRRPPRSAERLTSRALASPPALQPLTARAGASCS